MWFAGQIAAVSPKAVLLKYASSVGEAKSAFFKIKSFQIFGDSSGKPPHPPMHDSKAMSFAILVADAFGRPTTDGISDVGRQFNGTEAISQTMPKGVDDISSRHRWL